MIRMSPLFINSLSCRLIIAGQPLIRRGRGRLGSITRSDLSLSPPSHFWKATVTAFIHFTVYVGPWWFNILKMNWIKLLATISLPLIPLIESNTRFNNLGRNLISLNLTHCWVLLNGNRDSRLTYFRLNAKIWFKFFIKGKKNVDHMPTGLIYLPTRPLSQEKGSTSSCRPQASVRESLSSSCFQGLRSMDPGRLARERRENLFSWISELSGWNNP